MDIGTRILKARLAEKIDSNREYSDKIRLKNTSHYRKQECMDKKGGR